MLTQERLKELLHYDPETGVFRWRAQRQGVKVGSIAGYVDPGDGYRRIKIDQRLYRAHRLAWFYVHGEWPSADIDHRGLVRDDNRIGEIRPATRSQNRANTRPRADNASGFKGVCFRPHLARWEASLTVRGKRIYLGVHDSPEAASEAYRLAAIEHYGEFARAL